MTNLVQASQAAISGGGVMAGISSQGRSGFQSNVMTRLDSIESKLSGGGGGGGGAMPVEQPPVLPPGNLGGNLAQPDPVEGGGGALPLSGNGIDALSGGRPEISMGPTGEGMNPIAGANVNEQLQMPQGRSYI